MKKKKKSLSGAMLHLNKSAACRAAVNSPIQGSAADIVILALNNTYFDPILDKLRWKPIMQVHDEIIFEGPEEYAEMALPRIVHLMGTPFKGRPLPIPFPIDAKICKSWGQGK